MNQIIRAENISTAWLKSIQHLLSVKRSAYNLCVEIRRPAEENLSIRNELDKLLRLGDQVVETVANTIFPSALYRDIDNRTAFYEAYFKLYPMIRKISDNKTGTYFGRMVAWENICGLGPHNQVEQALRKFLNHRENNNETLVHTIPIYNPRYDRNVLMGFPCMSFLIIQNSGNNLNLTACYRNQYFFKKAYGNYVGLGRLLRFICDQAGYNLGSLTCIATHATLESGFTKNIRQIINRFEADLIEEVVQ